MAFKTYTLTLDGAVQNVATALGLDEQSATLPYRQVILSQVPANTAVIYVGDKSTISATDHGFSLDPTQATAVDKVSLGPFPSGAVKLKDLYVLGTANELLAIAGVPF